jgi:nickel-dependent lactate racemase
MTDISLGYGNLALPMSFDEGRFSVLAGNVSQFTPLSDREISAAFDSPVDSPPLEDVVADAETVLIVVPDATRSTASAQIVNLLVRRLIAAGIEPFNIRIIFATGLHRAVTAEEKSNILGPFISQRIKTLDHHPRDLMQIVKLGETSHGIPIGLNRALLEHDRVIVTGGVTFHYFAGFTGGRKLVCPGLASSKTINETHKLAFDFEKKARREGVGTGRLEGNAVHEAFVEIVEKVSPAWSIQSIVDENGRAVKVFAGHWKTSHETACEFYARNYSLTVPEKRRQVIVSCGGAPYDTNLIQAHKALQMAASVCEEGGTILWLAECADGLGRNNFLDWFAAENSAQLADRLSEKYQVNGQTAWSLMSITEKYRVIMVTLLPEEITRRLRVQTARDLPGALSQLNPDHSGYIVPYGAKFRLK